MIVGVISDTHGLLRPQAVNALRGSEHIIHAGDVGAPEILERLREIAPLTVVRGNVDVETWSRKLPATEIVELGGSTIYVLHNIRELDLKPEKAGFAAVIYGHTHKPGHELRDGVLFFNPGSAGPRRFRLPVTIGRLRIEDRRIEPEIIDLKV